MYSFQIGQKVSFLNEEGTGIILRFNSSNQVVILDEFEFEREMNIQNLVPIHSENYQLENITSYVIETKKETPKTQSKKFETTNTKSFRKEIDLHIENLVDSHRGMGNAEILQIQMTAFRQFFYQSLHHHLTKIVVIHGVGEGVLRSEIRQFIDRYEWSEFIEYMDASYQSYGQGATEINIAPSLFNRL